MAGHIAKFEAKPGRRAELIEALRPMFEEVKKEAGTLQYMMHTVPTEPDTVWFYERYRDAAAFEIHRTSRAHDNVIEAVKALVTKWPPEIHHLELVASKS